MILEIAELPVRAGESEAFEAAFRIASPLLAASPGYQSHQLQRGIERDHLYVLLVYWNTVEDHTIGFRGSQAYQEWRSLLHHFYEPAPSVEHFSAIPV